MKKLNINKYLGASWFGIYSGYGDSISTTTGLFGTILKVANFLVSASVLVAIAIIIFGGYMLITSAGDSEKVDKGWKAIQAAIIGMIIVFLTRAIIEFVVRKLLS